MGASRFSQAHSVAWRVNPLARVAADAKKALGKASEKLDTAVGEASSAVKDVVDSHHDKEKMNGIDIFRMMMCHARPDLLHHEKCMKFMTKRCAEATSGQGLCKTYYE